MKRQRNKYIQVRVPASYKDIFYEQRELIKQEIDKILNQQKQFKPFEITDPYDERVSFPIDELYYEKLEELAKKYNIKIGSIIRSIFFQLS
jgi:hypothetical protein